MKQGISIRDNVTSWAETKKYMCNHYAGLFDNLFLFLYASFRHYKNCLYNSEYKTKQKWK